MTTTNNIEQILNNDDIVVELFNSTETLTLKDRIEGNIIELNNYLKHDGGKGRKTGTALLLNQVQNLSVIDIDINKTFNDEMRDQVRTHVLSLLSDDDVIVKTGSGGLHIYCNTEFFPFTSNRMIKCFTSTDYDVDLMGSIDSNKRSLIVLPGTRVRQNATTPITNYTFIRGGYESQIKRSVNDILSDLDIKIKNAVVDENNDIPENDVTIDDTLARALVDGLYDFEIHNDGGNRRLNEEITLFTLFQAINSLPKQYIEEAYDNVYQLCKLTENAKTNFENARARYEHMYTSPYVLVKILKLYNNVFYDEFVKPLLQKPIKTFKIDLDDSFSITDIRKKAENKEYKNNADVIEDLSKVIRFIDSAQKTFVQKEYNTKTKTWGITFLTDKAMKESLKMIKLWNEDRKTITAYDVLLTQLTKLTVRAVEFNSTSDDVLSVFQGYKYNVLEKVNMELIKPFLYFINEVVCDSHEESYKYVIGWIAHMLQNPGVKNETALILKGLQGIGKNRFTDVLCELTSGYSEKNITDIAELTGNFNSVVENKMLVILNELRNFGEDRMVNFNSLKSIITDDTIRINEKNQPRRTAENVANFIFVSNNSYPVKIELGDRRYVVLQCNGKYKGQFEFFKQLVNSFTKEFYDNLLTYFMKYDLSSFNVRNIPMTEAKEDLIEASRNPLDVWICEHYDELCAGMLCVDALMTKPVEMKERAFQLQIKDKCDRRQKQADCVRKWFYVLKEECKSIYKQANNTCLNDEYIEDDEIPTHDN